MVCWCDSVQAGVPLSDHQLLWLHKFDLHAVPMLPVALLPQAHTQMALLLSKYDSNVTLKTGNVRQQLDHLVDELFERVTVCALLDPPQKYMSCFMLNVETGEFESYPQGWWRQVVEVSGGRVSAAQQEDQQDDVQHSRAPLGCRKQVYVATCFGLSRSTAALMHLLQVHS
jgi:hypothetical protein